MLLWFGVGRDFFLLCLGDLSVLQDISLCRQRIKRTLRYLTGELHIGIYQHLQGGLYLVPDRLLPFRWDLLKYRLRCFLPDILPLL